MNDITALAQRMKVKAVHAKKTADWGCDSDNFHDVATPDNVLALVEALEKAQQDKDMAIKMADARSQRIAELERMESSLRPVGVMSQAAYHRLENRESRFIALWPRPEIYLPRKRPDDGVIVYARTAGIQVIEGEGQ
ncbi:TPA: hypothetical protein R0C45_003906 [Kluyvera ascorbata F0526]|nr:hypothetical protein [Kluyvera ascorbata F0526]